MTSQNLFQNIGMIESSSMRTTTARTDFTNLLGVHSSGFEESTRKASNMVNMLDDESDGDKHA